MEGFACVIKEEKIVSYEECTQKALVLKIENPFAGYYSCYPQLGKQNQHQMFFLAIKSIDKCIEDKIWRLNIQFKNEIDYCFEATFGYLSLYNSEISCIGLDMVDVKGIPVLLKKFEEAGVKFLKYKKVEETSSIIHTRRFIDLIELFEDVYKGEQDNYYYIKVSALLSWKKFSEMILSIKGKPQFKSFDAAQMSLYQKSKVTEFIRIYTKSFNKDDLVLLKNELQKQVTRYFN